MSAVHQSFLGGGWLVQLTTDFTLLSSFGSWVLDLEDVTVEKSEQELRRRLEEKLFGGSDAGQEPSGDSKADEVKGLLKGLGL
jgi:hypothetical protein